MLPRLLPVLLLVVTGCGGGYSSTLLPTAELGELPYQYRVTIPDGYDVRSVDYDASLVGIASGENTTTTVQGRGVVTVYAIEQATGAEVVLIYDDIRQRQTPSAITRLERESRAER